MPEGFRDSRIERYIAETLDIIGRVQRASQHDLGGELSNLSRAVLVAAVRNAIVGEVADGKKAQEDSRLDVRLRDLRLALEDDADQVDDQVRELYSELLEEFRDDPQALGKIRALGEDFATAVERGDLPRAMVMRGSSRKPS